MPDFDSMAEGLHILVDEPESIARRFCDRVRSELRGRADKNRCFRLALSGGSAADYLLPALQDLGPEEQGLEVYWCDERAVPLSDARSNYRQAHELWLGSSGVPKDQVFPLYGDGDTAQLVDAYERKLMERRNAPIDLAVLGVGPDGHVASLFPQHVALLSHHWIEIISDSPKPPPRRLTMTLALLARVPCIVAAFGKTKADIIARAVNGETDLPLGRLIQENKTVTLLLDSEAAGQLDI